MCGTLSSSRSTQRRPSACGGKQPRHGLLSSSSSAVSSRHVQQHGGVTLAHEHVLRAKGGGTDGHSTSGLKFRLLVPWLKVGCNVLLSDVDVVYLRDPFQSSPPLLHRDSDVEETPPTHVLDTS